MITTCSRLVNNWEQAVRTSLVDKLRDFYACSPAFTNEIVVEQSIQHFGRRNFQLPWNNGHFWQHLRDENSQIKHIPTWNFNTSTEYRIDTCCHFEWWNLAPEKCMHFEWWNLKTRFDFGWLVPSPWNEDWEKLWRMMGMIKLPSCITLLSPLIYIRTMCTTGYLVICTHNWRLDTSSEFWVMVKSIIYRSS
jgi:hypothetical protein